MDRHPLQFGATVGAVIGLMLIVWIIVRGRRASATLPIASSDGAAPIRDGVARIEIVTSHPAFAFFYKTLQPNVRLDDELHGAPWGTSHFDVAPGTHTVAVSYPWLLREAGRATVTLTLQPGETKRVRYHARMIRFVPGKISVEGSLPEARALRD
jgi:hypothetical protein